jgi:hypothetical protein
MLKIPTPFFIRFIKNSFSLLRFVSIRTIFKNILGQLIYLFILFCKKINQVYRDLFGSLSWRQRPQNPTLQIKINVKSQRKFRLWFQNWYFHDNQLFYKYFFLKYQFWKKFLFIDGLLKWVLKFKGNPDK